MRTTLPGELLRPGLLARNTVWNIAGQALPILVALACIPILIREAGVERFGFLALAWAILGYAGLFDMGLARALTHRVSDRLGQGRWSDVPVLVGTGIGVALLLGLAGSAALVAVAPAAAGGLGLPAELVGEGHGALLVLAAGVPLVVATAGLRGVLEAYQRFDLVNLVRVPQGALTFLAPAGVALADPSLPLLVASLVGVRLLALGLHAVFVLRVLPAGWRGVSFRRGELVPLLRFGGWVTVSNVISPVMVYLDRFLIGAMISAAAVAWFVTPFEVVTRLLILPVGVMGVFFPAFAVAVREGRERLPGLYRDAVRAVMLLLAVPALALFLFAPEGLTLWVGAEFAVEGTGVARWLLLGLAVNAAAHVPFGFLQGTGRPDMTAKLHLIELPFYVLALLWALPLWGVTGAAAVWAGRVVVDGILLFAVSRHLNPGLNRATGEAAVGAGLLAAAMGWGLLLPGLHQRALLLAGATVVVAWAGVTLLRRLPGKRTAAHRSAASVALVLLVGTALLPGTAGAQSPQSPQGPQSPQSPPNSQSPPSSQSPQAAPASPRIGTEEERHLRAWILTDPELARRTGLVTRFPLPPRVMARSGLLAGAAPDVQGPAWLQLHPVTTRIVANSAFPWGRDEAPLWAGRGVSGIHSMGALVRAGPLTLDLRPAFVWAQNGDFELMENGRTGIGRFSDPQDRRIDWPQRPGEDPRGRLWPGESSLRLDLPFVALGAGTGRERWGPMQHFPILMGAENPGFPHVFLGTSEPLPLWIGHLHVQGLWGKLDPSEWAADASQQHRRFASSMVVVFAPRFPEGLEVGGARIFHIDWRDGGPTRVDFLRPFETFIKTNRRSEGTGSERGGGEFETRDNQLASAFFRWAFPGPGVEVYGEISRNDHSWDVRDFLLQPDHAFGYAIGAARAWGAGEPGAGASPRTAAGGSAVPRPAPERLRMLRIELANSRVSHLQEVRPQLPFYSHVSQRQGHTQRGYLLGSPAIYGGGGLYVGLDVWEPWGRWGVRGRRELRNSALAQRQPGLDPLRGHDVLTALTVDGRVWRKGVEWVGEVTVVRNLNRHFERDATNVRLSLEGRYRLTGR